MYKGWVRVAEVGEGGGGGWEVEGGLQLPLVCIQQCCVFIKGQKQA